jgi:hypothetical protein
MGDGGGTRSRWDDRESAPATGDAGNLRWHYQFSPLLQFFLFYKKSNFIGIQTSSYY